MKKLRQILGTVIPHLVTSSIVETEVYFGRKHLVKQVERLMRNLLLKLDSCFRRNDNGIINEKGAAIAPSCHSALDAESSIFNKV